MAEGGGDRAQRLPASDQPTENPDGPAGDAFYDSALLHEELAAQVEDDDDSALLSAHTPRLTCPADVAPDTVENVRNQAENVLVQFMHDRFTHDQERHRIPDSTPAAPELSQNLPQCFSPEAQVGRQLANIGDDIQRRYNRQFSQMLKVLNVQQTQNPYESFRAVAIRLFSDGNINWGRVIALFCFGYRIAIHNLTSGTSGMIKDIIRWIIQFMMRERISTWIAEHGGWGAVLKLVEENLNLSTFGLVLGTAALSILVTLFFTRKNS